jgi:hypothetical protein
MPIRPTTRATKMPKERAGVDRENLVCCSASDYGKYYSESWQPKI